MSNNKTGKYLKYAIGEIILVMIGILLALQVNNWNEKRLAKSEEQKLLKSLRSELEENILKFDSIYSYHTIRDSVLVRLIDLDPKVESFETQDSLINKADWSWTFNPSKGIYNSIINSGKIELISNNSLRIKISKLNDVIEDYQEDEITTVNYTSKNIEPLFTKIFSYYNRPRTKDERAQDSLIYAKIIPSRTFQNQMIYIRYAMQGVFEEGPRLRKELVSIIKIIDDELEPN